MQTDSEAGAQHKQLLWAEMQCMLQVQGACLKPLQALIPARVEGTPLDGCVPLFVVQVHAHVWVRQSVAVGRRQI